MTRSDTEYSHAAFSPRRPSSYTSRKAIAQCSFQRAAFCQSYELEGDSWNIGSQRIQRWRYRWKGTRLGSSGHDRL